MSLELILPNADPVLVLEDIEATLARYEADFSRFQPNSLVSRLNRGESVTTTSELTKLMAIGTELSQLTNGLFNPHVNLSSQGYAESFESQNFRAQTDEVTVLPFPQGLIIEGETITLKPNMVIDFGGFLKGYLSEQLAEKHKSAAQGLIVNLGGDLTVRGSDLKTDSFQIGIVNPVTKTEESVWLKNQSLSTSGSYKRRWHLNGEAQHHLINPTTHRAAETDIVSASVYGSAGAECDAFATALFAATPTQIEAWRQTHTHLNFLTIDTEGNPHFTSWKYSL